jgi:hypothetical protein
MVSVIDAFLPLCHEFLGRIFVEIPWTELLRKNPWSLPKAISPLLHIAVKLAAEPQVRLVSRAKNFLHLFSLQQIRAHNKYRLFNYLTIIFKC